jgi:beta-glucanase (GH16 family)
MMTFPEQFRSQLEAILAQGFPSDFVAFAFNLCELGETDARYGIELVGSSEFDPDDSNWACAEVWTPEDRFFRIPRSHCDAGWEDCLACMSSLVTSILSEQTLLAAQLLSVRGGGIGFFDGDLEVLSPVSPAT